MITDTREQVYDERINPLMAQIIEICKANNISFLASFQLTADNDEEGALLCSSCILGDDAAAKLEKAKNLIYNRAPVWAITTITKQGA